MDSSNILHDFLQPLETNGQISFQIRLYGFLSNSLSFCNWTPFSRRYYQRR
jgi:hypothetical protein